MLDVIIPITVFFIIVSISFISDNKNINLSDYLEMWKDLFKALSCVILVCVILCSGLIILENIIKIINPPCSIHIPTGLVYQCVQEIKEVVIK